MNSLSLIDSPTFAFWSPGPAEMMVLAVVALLLYGGNLPEVARSWGKSFADFRRGLSGIQNELNDVIYSTPEQIAYHDDNGHDDKGRDDAYLTQGYDDPEAYQEEATSNQAGSNQAGVGEDGSNEEGPNETGQHENEEDQREIDESEKTVGSASADTIVVDDIDLNQDIAQQEKSSD